MSVPLLGTDRIGINVINDPLSDFTETENLIGTD